MFERFTDRARRVVVLAQEEAKMLNHNYIGTEHILLGLIHEGEGVAAKALESLGISLDAVREQVQDIIGQGQQQPTGHIPFTPRAKKVLELSLREALQLGHNYIGTEHILLGLVREGEGVAAQVLVTLGADLSRVRQRVIQVLSGFGTGTRSRQAYRAPPPAPRCLLCGRTLDRVNRALVVRGENLCDECVRDAAQQIDELEAQGAPRLARFRRRATEVDDESEARLAIGRAFDAVYGAAKLPFEEAFWAVESGAELEPQLQAIKDAREVAPFVVNDITVERVEFVDETEAEVSLGIWFAGRSSPVTMPAHAVLQDGTWKVSRETIEQSAAQARQLRRPPT